MVILRHFPGDAGAAKLRLRLGEPHCWIFDPKFRELDRDMVDLSLLTLVSSGEGGGDCSGDLRLQGGCFSHADTGA
jgi:hypothetical protein